MVERSWMPRQHGRYAVPSGRGPGRRVPRREHAAPQRDWRPRSYTEYLPMSNEKPVPEVTAVLWGQLCIGALIVAALLVVRPFLAAAIWATDEHADLGDAEQEEHGGE